MSDTLLIDACRALGLPCRGRVLGRVVTWTTDADVAERSRQAGATIRTARGIFSHDPIGFEVSFDLEQYALTPADHAAS